MEVASEAASAVRGRKYIRKLLNTYGTEDNEKDVLSEFSDWVERGVGDWHATKIEKSQIR